MGYKAAINKNRIQHLSLSEEEQAKIIQSRALQIMGLVEAQMEAKQPGMGMMISPMLLLLQSTSPVNLRSWLICLDEILRVVGKWDLPQEDFQSQVEKLILPLLQEL